MPFDLAAEDRRLLVAVLDRLIPPVDDLAAAGAMGVADDIARMAAAHGRYAAALAEFLRLLAGRMVGAGFAALGGDDQDAVIAAIEQAAPGTFAIVIEVAYLAYYSRSEVHRRIGWRTGPLQPRGFELPPFDEAILDAARKRAPFWRQAPD